MIEDFSENYKLGETPTEVHIETSEENKSAVLSLAKQANYSIDIFTQDMDAKMYNNEAFEDAIFKLARRHPSTRIRILVQDPAKAIQKGHCLIRLAQSLTSSVFIHNPALEHKDEKCSFMVVDRLGLLTRVSASNKNYKARVNFMSPQHAKKLSEFFNNAWQHSTPDIQTRRIYT